MLKTQKTLKTLVEEFNSLLETNFKREIGRTDVPIGKRDSGLTKNVIKSKYEIKCSSLYDLINSNELVLVEKNFDNLLISFLSKEAEFKTNFDIFSFTLGSKEYRNCIELYLYNFNENLYNFSNKDYNKNKRKIIINFKQKNITVRDSTYVSSTENVKCMSGIKLHEDSKIYEDLTLDEILKSFIEDDRKNIEENRKYEEKKNNILIENRLKFENKLKELNITEEDFNLLVSLSKK